MPTLEASRDAPEQERWLTLGQACKVLGVDESTLRRWADSGHVHAFRTPGRHRRFAQSEIQELLSGRGRDGRRYRELGDLTASRIRRQLHRRPMREAHWYATVDEAERERLRPLGRRLAALAADYLGRRTRRAALLDDAHDLGREYGRELATSGLPLAQAVEAFIFFRRSLDDATKQATQRQGLSAGDALTACQQVAALADQVLVGLTEGYEQSVVAMPQTSPSAVK
ncbi:MAG: helix-turn-helix domain-containing protein [Dehalococcoidia bacterium]|nr:helix-turn-helix domain-containing protein [Dehalococcoidia bacterium]MDZ4278957.1 helix-turn-helix domain-containing protein [Dehalococcoidia bacterium]